MNGYLRVNNLSKGYKQYTKPRNRLLEWVSFRKVQRHAFNWVLQNINLEVLSGESVGIIGKNGAGKSTLLKLITGTTKPTDGSIAIKGRVAALLELGLGFHPNFSGRENIFMAGQLLGFSSQEIQDCLSEIEKFAEIGDYINQPVRVYSSGMLVRLGFSIATAIRPDVLIVDEALSVGDIYFQQKCYERISQFKEQGTIILFVSHDLVAINTICDRAIYLKDGSVAYDGKPAKAIDYFHADYLKADASLEQLETKVTDTLINSAPEVDDNIGTIDSVRVRLTKVEFLANKKTVGSVTSDSEITLSIKLHFLEAFNDPHVGFKIRDRLGVVIFETNSYCMRKTMGKVNKNEFLRTNFTFKIGLIPGEYSITVGVANGGYAETEFHEPLLYVHGVAKLTVLRNYEAILWAGIYNLRPNFSCLREVESLGRIDLTLAGVEDIECPVV